MSKVIKNGTIVTADRTWKADVLIKHDKIVGIGPDLHADHEIDATGCYVMPGGIDPHTHLEMPFMGTYSSDDFESGTRAAVSGGTTMVVDFCLPSPGQSLLEAIQMWDNKSTRANCDYSFHMAITWWGEQVFNEMPEVVKRGITSFKHFMAYKGALMVNDDEMYASFQRCAEPLYVVHTSCEQAHEAIRRARQKGMRVFGEPLIQHLTLDESEYANKDWDHAARRVMSPPFRNKLHQDSLWAGLQAGSLQVVATDHCAFTTEQKRYGVGDFTKIPNGTGGLEDRMPMLWTYGVNTGRLTMNEFVAVTSTNIAKILNMYPKKGAIVEGADADIVVWDPEKSKTIRAKSQQSAIDYNVFEGKKVTGLPRYVLSRGHIVVNNGKVDAKPGHGEFVAREPHMAVNKALSTWKELVAPRKVGRSGIPASGV
jgi:dihydropyrimidinase